MARAAKTSAAKTRAPKIRAAKKGRGKTTAAATQKKTINLALQGGGAHGAFTWGVCDRLLEDPRVEIEGITGSSAGAMNAAVLAYGDALGGAEGARKALADFWTRIAEAGRYGPFQRTPWEKATGDWRVDDSPAFWLFDFMSRVLSPYQLNPANYNPLRDILEKVIDFDLLRHATGIKLFVCATNVRSGKPKVFRNGDLCVEALLASACLPFLFQAVEHQGEHYWDGGYVGNPAIYPLIYNCKSPDIVLVQINPLVRDEVPNTAREILDRVNEITFNSSLIREMRAIQFVTRLIESGALPDSDYKRLNLHMIECEAELNQLGASSKMNSDPDFIDHLFKLGRGTAEQWLAEKFEAVGQESSLDLAEVYL